MTYFKYIVIAFIILNNIHNINAQNTGSSTNIEFAQDTARVEQKVRNMLEQNWSTVGMIEASAELEKGYDELLNKYYNKLLQSVSNDDDKKVIRDAQRNWIKLRDSDIAVIRVVKQKVYDEAGGGTIWGVIGASARADITKRRVIEIYNFLTFGDIGG